MKTKTTLMALISVVGTAYSSEFVKHPTPKEPKYIQAAIYEELKPKLLPLPEKDSARQKQDEAELFRLQNTRTEADCENAKKEVFVSLKNFYGGSGLLDSSAVDTLTPFFEQIGNDGDYFIQKLKKDFPRQRPFLYVKGINPCVPKESTGAYPSGHAVLSKLYALTLADLYRGKESQLDQRSKQIGEYRVLSGMHHPSDVEAGRSFAELIYRELKKSKSFQEDFEKMRIKLASSKTANTP